jgi:hypothetical protein
MDLNLHFCTKVETRLLSRSLHSGMKVHLIDAINEVSSLKKKGDKRMLVCSYCVQDNEQSVRGMLSRANIGSFCLRLLLELPLMSLSVVRSSTFRVYCHVHSCPCPLHLHSALDLSTTLECQYMLVRNMSHL